ncbi:hypothetical protein [Bremerella cremea]|uniref:hypothetical protein n=1 Tax=Bremerella cremea TaxID=1031537 RepID=UPI0031EB8FEE
MSNTAQALAILKQARDTLMARMTEAIVEQAEEIQADAAGESFLSEIESLYDQMGHKLSHLNQMISNLPADSASESPPPIYDLEEEEEEEVATENVRLPHFPLAKQPSSEVPVVVDRGDMIGLPAPGVSQPKAPAFARFVSLIEQGELDPAGDLIAQILGLSPYVGMQCAKAFSARYTEDPIVVTKAMKIREHVTHNRYNDALMLIHHCFGLQGIEAMIAMQKMREIVAVASNS